MAWTKSGYDAVKIAEQRRDSVHQELEIAKRDGLSILARKLEADLALAEDTLRQLKDAIATVSPSFIRGH